jgi:hypothetical protein
MLVAQPVLPVPLVVEFPFPAWATRASEAGPAPAAASGSTGGSGGPDDPFDGLP